MRFGFSQPIESRVNDMIAGRQGRRCNSYLRRRHGDDGDRRSKIMKVIGALPGAADLKMIPRTGLPSINIEVDRDAVARYGINAV